MRTFCFMVARDFPPDLKKEATIRMPLYKGVTDRAFPR